MKREKNSKRGETPTWCVLYREQVISARMYRTNHVSLPILASLHVRRQVHTARKHTHTLKVRVHTQTQHIYQTKHISKQNSSLPLSHPTEPFSAQVFSHDGLVHCYSSTSQSQSKTQNISHCLTDKQPQNKQTVTDKPKKFLFALHLQHLHCLYKWKTVFSAVSVQQNEHCTKKH